MASRRQRAPKAPSHTPIPTPTPSPDPVLDSASSQTASGEQQPSSLPGFVPNAARAGYKYLDLELTDDELCAPGTAKLQYQEIERLQRELDEARPFQKLHGEERERSAVLAEKLDAATNVNRAKTVGRIIADVWLAVAMCVGGFLLSHADSLHDSSTQIKCYIGAGIVMLVSIITKLAAL